ncbi:uncharacterized protein [Leptinotarsa decemlineata]|uniref:uncharacterized protein n=1 Tax=Leptinotarsa decemlineata TaxID=7539 RepID=UPI003D305862
MICPPNIVTAKECHICEKPFAEKDIIVRDHCHFSGLFRGFSHQACNLSFKKLFIVPITFHNLSGYDSHFIIRDVAKKGSVSILPINREKYIPFTQYDNETNIKFRFIDSYRFMGASLDELVSTLDVKNLKILKKEFAELDDEKFELLTKKGVFPYDYVDSVEKFLDTELPSKKHFYNKLNDCDIDDAKYAHAQRIWHLFDIKTLGEYSDLYMRTDILLLADVFENFREIDLKHMGWTLHGIILCKGTRYRGGISVCCNRYSEANNKYMPTYDPTKLSKYIMYFDVNNLYGWAMSQFLPYGGFEWVDTNIDVSQIPDDNPEGYILQVDLEYPEGLHDLHKDFPFCPEHRAPPNSKLTKLMPTLYNKTEYTLHYRNLKQALEHGLKSTKIHKVLKFKQSAWLRPYIELNTQLRTATNTSFEKNQFKLANNAIFGKTMENVRLHRIVKLVSSYEGRFGAKNLISSPRFHNRTIFDSNLMAIELKKAELIFNKPMYVGMAILDLSKTYNEYNIPLANKKVPGLMKDEANGKIITHFAGLRSKMYTYKVQDGKVVKKAKGVKYGVVKNKLSLEDYVDCLKNFKQKNIVEMSMKLFH